MPERRRYKRVEYAAFTETIENSVLKSWTNVIKKNRYNGVPFTLIEDKNGLTTNQENEVRPDQERSL